MHSLYTCTVSVNSLFEKSTFEVWQQYNMIIYIIYIAVICNLYIIEQMI